MSALPPAGRGPHKPEAVPPGLSYPLTARSQASLWQALSLGGQIVSPRLPHVWPPRPEELKDTYLPRPRVPRGRGQDAEGSCHGWGCGYSYQALTPLFTEGCPEPFFRGLLAPANARESSGSINKTWPSLGFAGGSLLPALGEMAWPGRHKCEPCHPTTSGHGYHAEGGEAADHLANSSEEAGPDAAEQAISTCN